MTIVMILTYHEVYYTWIFYVW